jgi:fructokinase
MRHTVVAYGEALWDMLPAGPVLGGAPLNFAYRAGALGNRSIIISRLGRDELGEKAYQQMQRLGMDTTYIQWDEAIPTGTVDIRFDASGNPDYTINENVAYDEIRLDDGMLEVVEEADCLCFGTLIQRTETSRETLSALLRRFQGPYRLLDINLRRNCYTEQTLRSSLDQADILKMNEEEAPALAMLYGIEDPEHDQVALPLAVSKIVDGVELEACVCTLGPRGALACGADGRPVYLPTYYVDVEDPCGSGDAFTAGFIHMLLEGRELVDAVRYGNAMGALVAAQKGATQPVSEGEIREIMSSGKPDRIDSRFKEYRV